jgi:hypothetical protein
VGVVRWYGIVASGMTTVAGQTIKGIKPVVQQDGSGFYVSPTSLVDRAVVDVADQRRCLNPLRVPSAVVPGKLVVAGVPFGSFGVAIDAGGKGVPVPFVVCDGGPRIGEGSPALARRMAGLQPSDEITLKNWFAGQVDKKTVLWVFFGGLAMPYDHSKEGYPDLFQPFGGFPDGVKVDNSYVTLPDLPGIEFEGKVDLFKEMKALSA